MCLIFRNAFEGYASTTGSLVPLTEAAKIISLHPSEEEIELYSLGRVDPEVQERIETHLLLCDKCCNLLTSLDDFHAVMKTALQRSSRQ